VGARDLEHDLPMQRSTLLGIASMSKPVTVALALMLVEEGRLSLQAPISRWAPEFAEMRVLRRPGGPLDDADPVARPITVEDLMTHRSGLAYGFMAEGPLAAALDETAGMGIESPLTPDAWIKALAALPLAYQPGERFNYGLSIDVLGIIVGRAAGSGLRQALRERLTGPLGMHDTDFWIPPDKRDRAAVIYQSPAAGSFIPTVVGAFVGPQPQAFASGGQGLVSTANDYLIFARLLLGRGEVDGVRLLKPETVELMIANRLTAAQRQIPFMGLPFWAGQGFGLGVSVITDPERHSWLGAGSAGAFGWPGMFGGWWQADPAQDMVMIWLQQVLPPPPEPGVMPRLPGMMHQIGFQKATYAALAE
jgi:CubicO group peptidase (beta-lactamase class C family)